MLVRRCVAGDVVAWEEIVQRYNRRIYNICYRFAGSGDDAVPGAIGCTQITEIRYTSGVALADALPPGFELTTQYAAAAMSACNEPEIAGTFVRWLTAPRSADLRTAGGFDP